ncbi:MAG: hypothetical protein KTR16_07415 [Acidiferrobacterales bacterium]|nr:hypothetical protein [Acidiferrobacterales bacterium]
MLVNYIPSKRQSFYLAAFVGLSCLAWLIISLLNVDGQPEKQIQSSVATRSQSDEHLTTTSEVQHYSAVLDQLTINSNETQSRVTFGCSRQCGSTLSMLDQNIELDDEAFQRLGIYIEEIADYLKNNDDKRHYFTQMALTTTDGDKRAYLTEVLKHLPEQQKIEIADKFIVSDNWRIRADGVVLIADKGVTNLKLANSLTNILMVEESPYVKSKILTHLQNSPVLRGDANVLRQLDSAIYYETNTSVQIAALKAKMQLSEKPYHIMPDALHALRSSDPDFQFAGLVAIEKVLWDETDFLETKAYLDMHSIENEFQIIQNLIVYDEDKSRFEKLIKEANAIYSRYFSDSGFSG